MKFLKTIFATLMAFGILSCTPENPNPWNPNWDNNGSQNQGSGENNGSNENQGGGQVSKAKPRYVWIDAAANFEDYANSKENINADLQKIKDAGFTDVIVDVRPTSGDVLFKSTVADPLVKVDAWTSGGYKWVHRTADFDYLQAFIDGARKVGLKVNASINTFTAGYLCPYGLGTDGMLFRDSSKKSWASVVNTKSGLVNTMDLLDVKTDYGTKFLNPANQQVQKFLLQLLADLAAYDLDGIILDRCRFDDYGLMSEFSDDSRRQFESYIGRKVSKFPSDIFAPGQESLGSTVSQLQKQWLEFRAKVIHDFVEKAANKVHAVNPDVRFGAYVGAWYSSYYTSGVNWASPKFDVSSKYSWASPNYKKYGYADHCDFMFLGAYAGVDSIWGHTEWTMQGFCEKGRELLMGDTVFAGGPDIGNSTGWTEGGQDAKIPEAINACITASDGFFAFDLIHIKMYNYWSAFKQGFDSYLKTVQK